MHLYLTHTHICTYTHRKSQNIHLWLNKHTPNHFQLVWGFGGYVHLAVWLYQKATIRDLHMQNLNSHIDRLGQYIIPTYCCEIVDCGIECPVITTAVTCFSTIHAFTFFLPHMTHSHKL